MERRVLLAISLSFLVLFLYQTFVMPPPVRPPERGDAGEASEPAVPAVPAAGLAEGEPTGVAASAAHGSPGGAEEDGAASAARVVVGDVAEREIVVETALVRAVLTNRGARVVSWVLKAYRGESGEPLELVPRGLPNGHPTPFTLDLEDAGLGARLNDALYRPSVEAPHVDGRDRPVAVEFELQTADGVQARKRFAFTPDGYIVRFTADVRRNGERLNPGVRWGPGLGEDLAREAATAGFFSGAYAYPVQAIYYTDGDIERVSVSDLARQPVYEGTFRYGGITDHYFVSSILDPAGPVRFAFTPIRVPDPADPAIQRQFIDYTVRFAAPPEEAAFFFGPKQFDVLRAIDPEFTKVIWFGVFAPLAVPLLGALTWVHGYVGNWGWSIIVLTILINLAMFPLRHKSVVAMRKMQELQPQLKAIQARYAKYKITDPERQKMNQEVMALYREKGVNPASGCLPMLLTFPVLFAFYSLLSQAIELRGADFGGWIDDLSRPDPLYVTPLLMGASMVWQMRITPSTADPTQQKVMQIMPVLFTVMFLWAPSGLVLYWLVSNVWAIGQQYFTNWLIGPPRVAAPAPAMLADERAKASRAGRRAQARQAK